MMLLAKEKTKWMGMSAGLALVSLSFPSAGIAQEKRDAKNRLLYRVSSDGCVASSQNVLPWKIDEGGKVFSYQNVRILALSSDGEVISTSNILVGQIDDDGKVWASMSKKLGRVTKDGTEVAPKIETHMKQNLISNKKEMCLVLSVKNTILSKASSVEKNSIALFWRYFEA